MGPSLGVYGGDPGVPGHGPLGRIRRTGSMPSSGGPHHAAGSAPMLQGHESAVIRKRRRPVLDRARNIRQIVVRGSRTDPPTVSGAKEEEEDRRTCRGPIRRIEDRARAGIRCSLRAVRSTLGPSARRRRRRRALSRLTRRRSAIFRYGMAGILPPHRGRSQGSTGVDFRPRGRRAQRAIPRPYRPAGSPPACTPESASLRPPLCRGSGTAQTSSQNRSTRFTA